MTTKQDSIRKETAKSPLSVSRVYKGDFQKSGTLTAEIKQTVETISHYPAQVVVDSLQDNIFSTKDFKFEEKKFENKEVRVAWIDVPEGLNEEQVREKLASFKAANLYRILSNRPILSDRQQHASDNPELPQVTMDTFANAQAVRYPENHPNAGALALDKNGKIQYRGIFFASQGSEDKDMRTADLADFYASEALTAELTGSAHVVGGQQI
jgi:hypothetical protein